MYVREASLLLTFCFSALLVSKRISYSFFALFLHPFAAPRMQIFRKDWDDVSNRYSQTTPWAPVLSFPLTNVTPGTIPVISLVSNVGRSRAETLLFIAYQTLLGSVALCVARNVYSVSTLQVGIYFTCFVGLH